MKHMPTSQERAKIGFWRDTPEKFNRKCIELARQGQDSVAAYIHDQAQLPDARAAVDPRWSSAERGAVIAYLKRGRVSASYRGWANCRLCNLAVGSKDLTDGAYVWPEGFPHYVERHGVRPPQEFVNHVLRRTVGPRR
jgi:hypothetical protein